MAGAEELPVIRAILELLEIRAVAAAAVLVVVKEYKTPVLDVGVR
jgi:hypothetical protein